MKKRSRLKNMLIVLFKIIGWSIIIFPLEFLTTILRFFILKGLNYQILIKPYAYINIISTKLTMKLIKDILPQMEQDEKDRLTYDDLKDTYNRLQEYDSTNPYIKFEPEK